MKLALAESATDCTIMCGTLFAKFNVSIHEQWQRIKTLVQTFFDNRKKNDCHVQMSVHYLIMNMLMTLPCDLDIRSRI